MCRNNDIIEQKRVRGPAAIKFMDKNRMTSLLAQVLMLPRVMMEIVYSYAREPQTEYFPKRQGPVLADDIVNTMWAIQTIDDFVSMCEANNLTSDDYDRPSVSNVLSLFSTSLILGNVVLVRYMHEQRLKRNLQWTRSPKDYSTYLPAPNLLYSLQGEAGAALLTPLSFMIDYGTPIYVGGRVNKALSTIHYLIQEASDLVDLVDSSVSSSPLGLVLQHVILNRSRVTPPFVNKVFVMLMRNCAQLNTADALQLFGRNHILSSFYENIRRTEHLSSTFIFPALPMISPVSALTLASLT